MPAREFLVVENSEIVIAFVAPTGTDVNQTCELFDRLLRHPFKYQVERVKVTDLLRNIIVRFRLDIDVNENGYAERINSLMSAGNKLRLKTGRNDILSLATVDHIAMQRVKQCGTDDDGHNEPKPRLRTAYLIHQLKHPDEVRLLRRVYGPGFFLIGVHSSYSKRADKLRSMGVDEDSIACTLQRDLQEVHDYGQHTRKAFALADAYVSADRKPAQQSADVKRILEVVFGNTLQTPLRDEYCMFLAYSASFRSADLSRQVGAVLVSRAGDITATGSNEVPRPGGGPYWAGELPRWRDVERGEDSNEIARQRMIEEIAQGIGSVLPSARDGFVDRVKSILRNSSIWDITEYGRAIHAEMEAILSCSRAGLPTRGSTLYTTTFPCHNCAKHIVDAGVARVVYVEPYPKSRAADLLSDSIHIVGEPGEEQRAVRDPRPRKRERVRFEPFIGIGARRFVDLFSLHLSSGEPRRRKQSGKAVRFEPEISQLRTPLVPTSYLEREVQCVEELSSISVGPDQGVLQFE